MSSRVGSAENYTGATVTLSFKEVSVETSFEREVWLWCYSTVGDAADDACVAGSKVRISVNHRY